MGYLGINALWASNHLQPFGVLPSIFFVRFLVNQIGID